MNSNILELQLALNIENPIAKRTHAAFMLRTLGSVECATILMEALKNRMDSSLMRHELGYILGQMQHPHVCPVLVQILEDESEDILVRHECAEALGAIGHEESLLVLRKFSSHPSPEISETCQIAIDLINWKKSGEKCAKGVYLSHDPAPPTTPSSLSSLKLQLLDKSRSLFDRYRAMFSLRDMNNDESAIALLEGFNDSSALFRHEIAYVLGQMQRPVTVDGLSLVLRNKDEHRMVRHEAAEALGAIGGQEVESVLKVYLEDAEKVVQESCVVALNTKEYWESNDFDMM